MNTETKLLAQIEELENEKSELLYRLDIKQDVIADLQRKLETALDKLEDLGYFSYEVEPGLFEAQDKADESYRLRLSDALRAEEANYELLDLCKLEYEDFLEVNDK